MKTAANGKTGTQRKMSELGEKGILLNKEIEELLGQVANSCKLSPAAPLGS